MQHNYLLLYVVFVNTLVIISINCSNDINWNWNSTSNDMENSNSVDIGFSETQILKWTNSAMRFLSDFHLCVDSNVGSADECFKLSSVLTSQVTIYLGYDKKRTNRQSINNNSHAAHVYKSREEMRSLLLRKENNDVFESASASASAAQGQSQIQSQLQNLLSRRRKVFAVLPDSSSVKSSGAHDVVLALDPYPEANFGHLIGLFYIDFNVELRFCKEEHQVYISDQTCITVAKKPRCPNILEKLTPGYHPRRCHIDFLPTVYPSGSESHNFQSSTNLMECTTIPGLFADCPKLRPVEDTLDILCDATHTNNRRCDTSYSGIGTRCRLFQTCDRAVLIGGGWNRLHSNKLSLENMFKVEEMLVKIGFQAENVKMFYANGKIPMSQGMKPRYFSSAMKTGIRGHIRTLCETRHCADTLFIYLNNPTTIEGDFLLWDMDRNGYADDLEIYTSKEFLSDISRCEAKRVIVVADQSNSNSLMSVLKQSNEHQNVFLFTTGSSNQINTNGELTNILVNSTHPTSCINNFNQGDSSLRIKSANPDIHDSSGGTISAISLIGAPCDLNPPLQERELNSLYKGCQNIPTSIWFSLNYSELHDDDDEVDDRESNENSPSNRRNQ